MLAKPRATVRELLLALVSKIQIRACKFNHANDSKETVLRTLERLMATVLVRMPATTLPTAEPRSKAPQPATPTLRLPMLRRRTRWLVKNTHGNLGLRVVASSFSDDNDGILEIGYRQCIYKLEKGHYEFTLVTIKIGLVVCLCMCERDRERAFEFGGEHVSGTDPTRRES